jgi:hypothetical protein
VRLRLKPEVGKARVVSGTPTEWPAEYAFGFDDRQVIDAGMPQVHQAVLVEFPTLVAAAAEPVTAVVVPFVGKTHGNAVAVMGPDFFDRTIFEFTVPFAGQELLDSGPPTHTLGAIAPAGFCGVGDRNACGIVRILSVLGHAGLLRHGPHADGDVRLVDADPGRALHPRRLPPHARARGHGHAAVDQKIRRWPPVLSHLGPALRWGERNRQFMQQNQ